MRRFLVIPALILLLIGSVILSQSTVKNPHGQLKWDCQDCHTTDSWSQMRDSLAFDHAATGFQLVGAHASAQCIGCHKDPVFNHVGVNCIDCHADHHAGQLGQDCQNCHTPRDWQNRRSTLELHAANGFPLTGAHAVADCESCHRGHVRQEYAGTPVDCYDCHAADYAATEEPNHVAATFPLDCRTCHEAASASWHYASYNHPASFPLIGGHQGVACISCHPSGYTGTSSDCYTCHSADFASTSDPDHETGGFTHDCTLCHTINAWVPAEYDHNATAFPLTGAHQQTACVSCHATQYAGTPTNCYACHQTDYDQTTEPDHQFAQFDQNCTTCHTTSSWDPSSFDHANTGFALTGQHTTLICSSCHSTGFTGTPAGCYDCHQSDFESVTDPNHVTQGFSQNCTVCHTTNGWTPSSFNHANTAFPLTGKHVDASCTSCHTSGYAGTPTDCYSCHQSNFESTGDPNHVQANFSHTCTDCHTTSGWSPANFSHSATAFPLTGAHVSATCVSCHASGYINTPADCFSCHQTDFESVTDPSHVTNNFDHNCTSCHSTTAWQPATFDHNTTTFPLTGQHITAACIACHAKSYSGTSSACLACHQSDYDGTSDPVHAAAGFPTTCQTCHTTSGWSPANWDHDAQYFPITTGTHSQVWNDDCTTCHVSPSSYAVFECILCHEHNNKNEVDADHQGENDYQYLSTACYNCHPRGRN
ncbi:MAG: hypothetical protein IPH75_13070 [bacterium]|nr:hypothetical protein [bacterium]